MQVLNRWVMIVKPKQPFMDWVCSHDEFNPTEDEICSDATACLVPSYILISEQALIIEECYDLIFEEELFSWYTDETMWPEQRELKTFLEWFDVEFHTWSSILLLTIRCTTSIPIPTTKQAPMKIASNQTATDRYSVNESTS